MTDAAPEAGRVVLVTGASTGIGRACADRLSARGWTVYGVSRTIEQRQPRPAFIAVNVDVSRDGDVRTIFTRIARDTGRLDAVVNCAGYCLAGPIEETAEDAARRQFETNFHGLAGVCRMAARTFREQGHGRIVNIGSLAAHVPMAFQAYYSASKAAVSAFTHALRLELQPFGVQTVLIEPGDFATPFTAARELAAPVEGSRYPSFGRTLRVIERYEVEAAPPDAVAALVTQVLERPAPRAVLWIGPLLQRFGAWMRPLAPAETFDRVLRALYDLDGPSRRR